MALTEKSWDPSFRTGITQQHPYVKIPFRIKRYAVNKLHTFNFIVETSEPVLYLVICWAGAVSCIISIRAMAITVWNICLRPGSPHSRHSPSGAVTPREQIIGPPRESCPVCFTDFPLIDVPLLWIITYGCPVDVLIFYFWQFGCDNSTSYTVVLSRWCFCPCD